MMPTIAICHITKHINGEVEIDSFMVPDPWILFTLSLWMGEIDKTRIRKVDRKPFMVNIVVSHTRENKITTFPD